MVRSETLKNKLLKKKKKVGLTKVNHLLDEKMIKVCLNLAAGWVAVHFEDFIIVVNDAPCHVVLSHSYRFYFF